MSLHVLELRNEHGELITRTEDGKTVVIIESDKNGKTPQTEFSLAITELQGADARRMATEHANRVGGIGNPRVGFPGAPYPVDEKNNVVIDAKTQTIHRYRVDIPITQGLG